MPFVDRIELGMIDDSGSMTVKTAGALVAIPSALLTTKE